MKLVSEGDVDSFQRVCSKDSPAPGAAGAMSKADAAGGAGAVGDASASCKGLDFADFDANSDGALDYDEADELSQSVAIAVGETDRALRCTLPSPRRVCFSRRVAEGAFAKFLKCELGSLSAECVAAVCSRRQASA